MTKINMFIAISSYLLYNINHNKVITVYNIPEKYIIIKAIFI